MLAATAQSPPGPLPPPPAPPAPASSLLAQLRLAAGDIKLAHSVFALPFALLAAVLARDPATAWSVFALQGLLVVVCMVFARSWAMLVNRLADARFDARNPRTSRRAVASGALPARAGWLIALACAALFVLAAAGFWLLMANPWPLLLALPVLGWLALYSYAKRFTALCHVLLGTALAISPLAAALAIRPAALAEVPALWWLSGMVVLWVAGFDVIYALQDVDFDRTTGLFSIPSRLGVEAALWLSRSAHLLAASCLWLAWRAEPRFGLVFAAAALLASLLLVYEHIHLARRGRAGLEMAFFTINGVVSCVIGVLGIVDSLL